MKLNFHQVTVNELDENRNVIRTSIHETPILYPAEGKKLKNKLTGYVSEGFVCLKDVSLVNNFEEVD